MSAIVPEYITRNEHTEYEEAYERLKAQLNAFTSAQRKALFAAVAVVVKARGEE